MKKSLCGLMLLILLAPVFAQETDQAISAKLDVLINQNNLFKEQITNDLNQFVTTKEMNESFELLDSRVISEIKSQFPNLVLILIVNDAVIIGALLLMRIRGLL